MLRGIKPGHVLTFYQQILPTFERYLDKKQLWVFMMIFVLIILTVHVQCRLELSLKELGEMKKVTGERMNHKVYIITKKNKTHSLMESLSLSNRTEDPG